MDFQIIPAIDLMEGSVVRLEQGDAKRRTRYDVSPGEVARAYREDGARRIHVVDLDGAFSGLPKNLDAIQEIIEAVGKEVEVEIGGGVRTEAAVAALFEAGARYVVIGTKAYEDETFLGEMVRLYGERIIVGADAREGLLSTRGWTTDTQVFAVPFLRRVRRELGISTVIYTDIARDGMFTSPNTEALEEVLSVQGLKVIASGGVGSLDDIRSLRALNSPDLAGVIVGKALYDGRISLRDAIAVAAEAPPVTQA